MGKVIKKPVESPESSSDLGTSSKVESLHGGFLGGLFLSLRGLCPFKAIGGTALAKGVFTGVTGVMSQPLEGAKRDGMKGLVTGFGKVWHPFGCPTSLHF